MTPPIDAVWPVAAADLTDEQVLEVYEPPTAAWLRMNFVSSLDGAATRGGRAGPLGDRADRRVFELLRRWADVVLLGAGTVRIEGYGAMRLPDDAVRWRLRRSLPQQPVFALVSRRLLLDPESPVFADAPVRPIVYTVTTAPPGRRRALSRVADVVDAGRTTVDPVAVRADLDRRQHRRVHCEGGPQLFGSFIAADAVDELCLTLGPTLEASDAVRIASGDRGAPVPMTLVGIMRSGSELLLRYRRASR